MKRYINFWLVILIIIIIIFTSITLSDINQVPNKLLRILSSKESQLNAINTHIYIYTLPIILSISDYIMQDHTIKLYRYKNKEKYFNQEILVPSIKEILLFLFFLYFIMILLTIIEGLFIPGLIIVAIKSLIMVLAFYILVINIYILLSNLKINRYISIMITVLIFISLNHTNNFISNSLFLLFGGFDLPLNRIILLSIIFWYLFDWVLISINKYLFKIKDVR